MKKTFGIIGAGNIGQAVAKHLLKASYPVIISNSKGPETLQQLVDTLGNGVKAGTSQEAAEADIVLLAIPWPQVPNLKNLTNWNNKIIIDATNHFVTYAPDFKVADLGDKASSEVVAENLQGSRVVKAFNTLYFKILEADPKENSGQRVLFISGDDENAKKEVAEVIETLGFAATDLGSLNQGSKLQQAKGPLYSQNLIKL